MFRLTTPLEECRPYREIIEIGEKKGKEEGKKEGKVEGKKEGILLGKIQQLEEQFQEKVINQNYYETQMAFLMKQLDELGYQPAEG